MNLNYEIKILSLALQIQHFIACSSYQRFNVLPYRSNTIHFHFLPDQYTENCHHSGMSQTSRVNLLSEQKITKTNCAEAQSSITQVY